MISIDLLVTKQKSEMNFKTKFGFFQINILLKTKFLSIYKKKGLERNMKENKRLRYLN